MNLENRRISYRQGFRMGLLENITLGIVVIPFATINMAGKYHFPALLLGLALTTGYIWIMYFLSREMPKGIGRELEKMGALGKTFNLIYVLRFVIRGGVIVFFFGKVVQEYMLQSYNLWLIIVPFVILCGYGAGRGMEKRGRMIELLFWWMIVPIILVAVFSISSVSWQELPVELKGAGYESIRQNTGIMDVLRGAYVAFLITSSTELMLFSLPKQKNHNWRNTLKIALWIVIAILLSYVFVIGILGGGWVASDAQAALNVMEASTLPGQVVARIDYPVLAFWIIGVFTIVSGYMLHAKENLVDFVGARRKPLKRWLIYGVMAGVVFLSWVWSLSGASQYLAMYMFGFDVLLSLFVPVVVVMMKKQGILHSVKVAGLLFAIGVTTFITGCNSEKFKPIDDKGDSVENRDYVMELLVEEGDVDSNLYTATLSDAVNSNETIYNFTFTIADIEQYSGGEGKGLKTNEFICQATSLDEALEKYFQEKERQLDVGHLEEIVFKNIDYVPLVFEMSAMPKLGKSVKVSLEAGEKKEKIILRELIKNIYAGENFS